MIFIHNVIKIMYVNLGYLPNYPYHMISDEEMIDAFIGKGNYFDVMYPCPSTAMQQEYDALRECIAEKLNAFLTGYAEIIPDWVYSYMLGNTITYKSDIADIEDLFELADVKPLVSYDEFDARLAQACLAVSKEWLKKLPAAQRTRVPTMFGEAHVVKSLRLQAADIFNS